ncbi:MAG TPA: BrnT family toxin [Candidatus Sulfotelmatobacter sp.]|nr:BrnT family toxin [Candidatus Sulfotelmatobacter sp.]
MEFEWDGRKDASNFRKDGIDFEFARRIFAGTVLERASDRRDYGEARIIAVGAVEGVEIVVVFTKRGETRRLISARRAHVSERKAYREKFPERGAPEPD